MAHVETVGEIIGANMWPNSYIEIGGPIADAVGGVELQLIEVRQILQIVDDKGESVIPTNGRLLIALGAAAQRLRQPSLTSQK
ncbi:MAG: hypothetical protein GPOALKHO_000533 [Sodalis sp.]|nr:MAG: hypothetical protein GPOALKHO_000533 [Sodalis sp.]